MKSKIVAKYKPQELVFLIDSRILRQSETIVREFIDNVWNQGQIDLVPRFINKSYTIHSDAGDGWDGKTLDRQEFITRLDFCRKIFPDLNFAIEDLLAGEEKVMIKWLMTGTHCGDIDQLKATQRKIKVPGMTIYYLKDRKITGHTQVVDRFVQLQNLGVIHF